MVPPFDLFLTRGSSGSAISSELRVWQYSPLKMSVALCLSNWKRRTSLRKMKSGETLSMKYLRENLLRFQPSIFHVIEVNGYEVAEGDTEVGRDIKEAVF